MNDTSEGADLHNFGSALGGATDVTLDVQVGPFQFMVPIVQWNDQFGASANDYDLFLVNQTETDLLCPSCSSDEPQFGFHDPIEGFCYSNSSFVTARGKLAIGRFDGVGKRLELFALGGQILQYNTPAGSVFGHSGVPGAVATGAIDASDPGNDSIEFLPVRALLRLGHHALVLDVVEIQQP